MKKVLSLILVLLLSVSLLAACGDSEDSGDASSTGGAVADDGIFSTADVKYTDTEGNAVYRIIRSADGDDEENQLAMILFKQAKDSLGVTLKNVTDSEDGTDAYEILVGETNRPETAQAREYLIASLGGRKDDYIICTIGKKIVVYGMNNQSTSEACEYFAANYLLKDGVAGGIKYTAATDGDYKAITLNGEPISKFKIIRQHYNQSYVTQMRIDELIKVASDTYGYVLNYYEDAYVTEGDYEIVIGNANRTGVPEILNRDEYTISISGKKVYINGGSVNATSLAVSEFAKMLEKGSLTDADSIDGSYSSAIAGYDKSRYYTQTWGDDFDGDAVDTTKWYHVPSNAYSSSGMNGRTSIRSQDPNYVYVADGKFTISAGYNDTQYIGGMLMTDRTMLYKYGYLEMSAILPDGDGLWTSLWLDSRWHGYSGQESAGQYYDMEIDVNECFGNSTVVQANCHKWPTVLGEAEGYEHTSLDQAEYSNKKRRTAKDNGSFNNEFHTFGLLWDEDEMTFTCDGEAYFTYNINTSIEDFDGFHVLSYIRLSAAIGFANNPRGVILSDDDPKWGATNKFIVDYVYIYQLDDGVQQLITGDAIQ